MLKVAAIQLTSTDEVEANLSAAQTSLEQAANVGAELAVLPENFGFMGRHEADKLAIAEADGSGPQQDWAATQAQRLGLWLVAGTIPLKADEQHVWSTCLLFGPEGQRVARYNKIHLFDVELSEGESYRESASIRAGDQLQSTDTPFGRLGLAVCYDLRFPELFRHLAAEGMDILVLPSAFTASTGQAHWLPLIQARAIENQCLVIAPNQCGQHVNGRQTWGHSLIVDPWGQILADGGEQPGMVTADFDRQALTDLRKRFPVLQHRRPFLD